MIIWWCTKLMFSIIRIRINAMHYQYNFLEWVLCFSIFNIHFSSQKRLYMHNIHIIINLQKLFFYSFLYAGYWWTRTFNLSKSLINSWIYQTRLKSSNKIIYPQINWLILFHFFPLMTYYDPTIQTDIYLYNAFYNSLKTNNN